MNLRSIHFRLTLWYTALIVIVAIGFGVYAYLSLEHRLYGELNKLLIFRIEHLRTDILSETVLDTPLMLAQKIEDIYAPEESSRFVRISKLDGAVLYVSGMPREKLFDPKTIELPRDYTAAYSQHVHKVPGQADFILVGCVKTLDGKPYVFEMGASIKPVMGQLKALVMTLLNGLPIMIVIAVMGGSALVLRALHPVEAMRASAEQISFSNLRQRLPVAATDDAIEHLSKTLNQMLERLDQAYQQASRFSADASHELRTPLAIMRSELENILHTPETAGALRERIGSVLEENERLSNIVEGLFSLARLDAGGAKVGHSVFNLAALAQTTLEQMQLMAEEKNIAVKVDAPMPVFVKGDAGRMKQVVVNLLDNAIKYTGNKGNILLSVQAIAGTAILTVKDDGIGISEEALPHIFERFYRADKVRCGALQGAGLGLAIVSSICQAHGGKVDAESREGSGTTLKVELPLADNQMS